MCKFISYPPVDGDEMRYLVLNESGGRADVARQRMAHPHQMVNCSQAMAARDVFPVCKLVLGIADKACPHTVVKACR